MHILNNKGEFKIYHPLTGGCVMLKKADNYVAGIDLNGCFRAFVSAACDFAKRC